VGLDFELPERVYVSFLVFDLPVLSWGWGYVSLPAQFVVPSVGRFCNTGASL